VTSDGFSWDRHFPEWRFYPANREIGVPWDYQG